LREKFTKDPTSLPRSRFILGPDKTYFVLTPEEYFLGPKGKDATPRSESTLASLRAFLQERNQLPPAQKKVMTDAALGVGGAWWLRFADGSCRWDLAGRYKELEGLLESWEEIRDIDVRLVNHLPCA
jgi:hypothetical protein